MRAQPRPLSLLALVGTCLLPVACGRTPTIRIERRGDAVHVDVRTLGEYQTSVNRVTLREGPDKVIWDARSRRATGGQIDGFELRQGENSPVLRDTQGGDFEIVVPAPRIPFLLQRGPTYSLAVCGGDGGTRCSTVQIKF